MNLMTLPRRPGLILSCNLLNGWRLDGTILIVEPADEENATRMRALTIALLKKGLSMFGPCSFIWGSTCTAPRCWSFETAQRYDSRSSWKHLPAARIRTGMLIPISSIVYAILRKDTLKRELYHLSAGSRFLRFSKLHMHTGKRVNVAGIKMSAELGRYTIACVQTV